MGLKPTSGIDLIKSHLFQHKKLSQIYEIINALFVPLIVLYFEHSRGYLLSKKSGIYAQIKLKCIYICSRILSFYHFVAFILIKLIKFISLYK